MENVFDPIMRPALRGLCVEVMDDLLQQSHVDGGVGDERRMWMGYRTKPTQDNLR